MCRFPLSLAGTPAGGWLGVIRYLRTALEKTPLPAEGLRELLAA